MVSPREYLARLRSAPPSFGLVTLFLFVWLMVGFVSGTLTLLGPVRWITAAMRDAGFSDGSERATVLAVIAAYVASSFVFSWWTTRRVAASRRVLVRGGAPVLLIAAASGAFWMWTSPALVNSFQPVEVTTVARFTFGPYPEREQFEQLVAEGYTGIISLLNSTAVPFEAVLLGRERELAEEFGIELINAPLLPWVGGNADSLEAIQTLVDQPGGRYYVHCYLGRDRVGMVRRLVERANPGLDRATHASMVRLASEPAFERGSFERGEIHQVDEGVWFTPFPTDEEMLRYFIASDVGHVVSVLDPDNPDDVQWLEKESAALESHGVSYANMPVPWMSYSAEKALAAARHVREAPRPVVVHAFRSSGLASKAFRMAYATDLPPLPDGMFEEPMQGGQARIIGVNVAIGPRPAGVEFGTVLHGAGIRGVVYVGDGSRPSAQEDKLLVRAETELTWRAFDPEDRALLGTLAKGGPWYVYGPGLGVVQDRIEARFGPARNRLLYGTPPAAVAVGQ